MRQTVHKVRDIDDAGHALGIHVGQGACIEQFPPESIRDYDHRPQRANTRIRPGHVGRQTVDDLLAASRNDVAAQGAREAVGAREVHN